MKEAQLPPGVSWSDRLQKELGDSVMLVDDHEESVEFRIIAELDVEGRSYAFIQSEEQKKEGDYELFRVTQTEDGELELETIEDDEEWESVAELYDEILFSLEA